MHLPVSKQIMATIGPPFKWPPFKRRFASVHTVAHVRCLLGCFEFMAMANLRKYVSTGCDPKLYLTFV